MNHMKMPAFFYLVKFLAHLSAIIGVIAGLVLFAGGMATIEYAGLPAILPGLFMIIGSLASLGVAYCFLSLVQSNIETRNAVVSYIFNSSPESYKLFTSNVMEKSNQEHTESTDGIPW